MSDEEKRWARPHRQHDPLPERRIGTPEAPEGIILIAAKPGDSTVARCKTCGKTPPPP